LYKVINTCSKLLSCQLQLCHQFSPREGVTYLECFGSRWLDRECESDSEVCVVIKNDQVKFLKVITSCSDPSSDWGARLTYKQVKLTEVDGIWFQIGAKDVYNH
jgi:hypothetical protein